jgi:hypothetical protein
MTRGTSITVRLSAAAAAIAVAGCCSMQDHRLALISGDAERVASGQSVEFDRARFTVPEGWAGGKFDDGVVLTPAGKPPEQAGCWLILRKAEVTPLFLHDWVRERLNRDLGSLELVKKTEGMRRPGGRMVAFTVAEVKRCGKSEFWFYVGVPVAPRTAMPVIYHAGSEQTFNEHLAGPGTLLETIRPKAEAEPQPKAPTGKPPATKPPADKAPADKAPAGKSPAP